MQISPQHRIHNSAALRLLVVVIVGAVIVAAAVFSQADRRCGWNVGGVPDYGCAAL
jgi:hypothetical protein